MAAVAVTGAIRDPDFWWHLKTGQLILQRGRLFQTDPFTYTAIGHTWTMHEWLTEVLFAALYRVGGLGLIVAVLSGVTWLGLLFVMLRARLDRPNLFVLGAGMLLAAVAGYPIWGPRAQMITFALSCLTLWLADRHLRHGGRAALWLLPVFVIWSNLHSGFVIGLGFIGVMLAGEGAAHVLGSGDRAPLGRVRSLGLVLVGCLLASGVNLNGPGIILYPFGTQESAAQQSLILEWHSPDFHQWVLRPFGLMLVSLIILVVVNRRLRLRDAALVLVTVALSLQSVRHIALFVAAATPVWIQQADLLLRRATRLPSRKPAPLPVAVAVWTLLTGLLIAGYGVARLLPAMRTQERSLFYAREFPVCAASWLATAAHPLNIFNQYGEGGYLAWTLSGRGDRIFIFGDAALMGDQLLFRYGDVESVAPNWDQVIRTAGTDLVLFDTDTPLVRVLAAAPDWVQVYHDPRSIAFAPRDRVASLRLPPPPAAAAPGDACTRLAASPLPAPDGTGG